MSIDISYLEVQEIMSMLKLTSAQAVLDTLAEEASQKQWSYVEFLGKLLSEEISARKERRFAFKQRLAHFPCIKTLDQYDFSFQY